MALPGALGIVYGMGEGEQAGVLGQAVLWHGTPESVVSLHPPGAAFSVAYAASGGQQVGYVTPSGGPENDRAALWHGTSDWTNLNPSGAQRSTALATDGTHQGGWGEFLAGGFWAQHAVLWSGSAESAIDLNPAPDETSKILGMCPGQQVGWTHTPVRGDHAAVWSGSVQSLIDLHPFGSFGGSHLDATLGWCQVGWSHVPGYSWPHAGIWFNSAQSFVDLNQFLPAGYYSSEARAVDFYNGQLEVAGVAINAQGYYEAYLWRGVPAPGVGMAMALGMLSLGRRRR